jgi:type III secretory pathway component EscV
MAYSLFREFQIKLPAVTLLFGIRLTQLGLLVLTGCTTFINLLPLPTLAVDRLNKTHIALSILVLSLYVYAMCSPLVQLFTDLYVG